MIIFYIYSILVKIHLVIIRLILSLNFKLTLDLYLVFLKK